MDAEIKKTFELVGIFAAKLLHGKAISFKEYSSISKSLKDIEDRMLTADYEYDRRRMHE